MQEFKLIVAGGHDFTDYEKAKEEITRLAEGALAEFGVSIVSGMARGADALAVRFARELGITHSLRGARTRRSCSGSAVGALWRLSMQQ